MENTVRDLKDSGKITKNQAKGMLLEIAVYQALISMGIYPIPLHNPYDENYAKDTHLNVDMIFRYDGKTYAVECKNLNHNCEWSKEWVAKEVVSRFLYLEKTVPTDIRVIVTSYDPNNIPEGYYTLALHRETTIENLNMIISVLSKLFLSLFSQLGCDIKLIFYTWGKPRMKKEYAKLRRIDKKLKDVNGWIE